MLSYSLGDTIDNSNAVVMSLIIDSTGTFTVCSPSLWETPSTKVTQLLGLLSLNLREFLQYALLLSGRHHRQQIHAVAMSLIIDSTGTFTVCSPTLWETPSTTVTQLLGL